MLIVVASWLVRIERRRLERNIAAGWNLSLSLRLDLLLKIKEQLAEYLATGWRHP